MASGSKELVKAEGQDGMLARFVEELLNGAEPDDAKKIAGYAETTPTVSLLRRKVVENAISAAIDSEMRGPMKLKALKTLKNIMGGTSAQAALGAAKIVLEYGADAQHGDDKPMTELSTEELDAMVVRLEAERNARMKDVTPNNGA